MSEHTPGPWYVGKDCANAAEINGHFHHLWQVLSPEGADGVEFDGTGVACVIVPFEDETEQIMQTAAANAAFIVRACNNHDELLAALGDAIVALGRARHYLETVDISLQDDAIIGKAQGNANAAIAKAEVQDA